MSRSIGLVTFVKGGSNPNDQMPGCANYDQYHGGCLFGDICRVQAGQRCEYFEKVVLPTAKDTGQYDQIAGLYRKQIGGSDSDFDLGERNIPQRRCGCGQPLKSRRRICDKCRDRKRRQTYRRNRQNRKGCCATVN